MPNAPTGSGTESTDAESTDAESPDVESPEAVRRRDAYWRKNTRLIAVLLAIWALVSFGFAILFPGTYSIGKVPAGFWWAQQGSMYVFVVLIFVYAWRMDKIDREFDVHEED